MLTLIQFEYEGDLHSWFAYAPLDDVPFDGRQWVLMVRLLIGGRRCAGSLLMIRIDRLGRLIAFGGAMMKLVQIGKLD